MPMSRLTSVRARATTVLALGLSLLVVESLPALAEESPGPYFTAALGATRWHGDYSTGCIDNYTGTVPGIYFGAYACTGALTTQDTIAGRIGGGWRVNSWIALELAYANFGRASIDRSVGYSGALPDGGITVPVFIPEEGRYLLQGIDLSAIVAFPLTTNASLTGRLGAFNYFQTYSESGHGTHSSSYSWSASASGIAPLFGAGVAYRVDPALAFRAEWTRIQRVGKVYTGWNGWGVVSSGGGNPDGGHFNIDVIWLGVDYALR